MRNKLKMFALPLLAVLLLGSFPALGASRDTNLALTSTASVMAEPAAYYHHYYAWRHHHRHYRHWWYFGFGG
jgi:hypothetical protein